VSKKDLLNLSKRRKKCVSIFKKNACIATGKLEIRLPRAHVWGTGGQGEREQNLAETRLD